MAISGSPYRTPAPNMGQSYRSAASIDANRNNPHPLSCGGARVSNAAIIALTAGGRAGPTKS